MAELTLFDGTGDGSGDGTGKDAAPLGAVPDVAYSVRDLNAAIVASLRTAFPDRIWVRGEIAGLKPNRNGHRYFSLVEQAEGSPRPDARIDAVAFASRWRTIEWRLRKERIIPEEGMQFCFRGRVEVFEPTGRLQFVADDVDVEWTLGHMAAGRDRLLALLESDGLLRRNAAVAMPPVPLRIGLVTSGGSAAYNDFVHELSCSQIGFRVTLVDCQTQGPRTVPSIVAAIGELQRRRVDVIAVVRGGGSRTDLAWFDDEVLARTIATCEVPVFTGIGHEVDTSVADAVAHTAHKTPTAAAASLVEAVARFRDCCEQNWVGILGCATHRLEHADMDLAAAARHSTTSATRRLEFAAQSVAHRRHRLIMAARGRVAAVDGALGSAAAGLALPRLSRILDRLASIVAESAARLPIRARHQMERNVSDIVRAEAAVRAYDPARVLERGYSLTLDTSGRAVRDTTRLVPGQRVRTVVAHGEFTSDIAEIDQGANE